MKRSGLALILVLCLHPIARGVPHFLFDDLGFTHWRSNWQQTLLEAQLTGKPIYVQITHARCKTAPEYYLKHFSNWKIQLLLRRYYVCFACDFYKMPPEVARLQASKGYNQEQTPLHLILTPRLEVLGWLVQNPSQEAFEKFLMQAASDARFQMNKKQIDQTEKAVNALEKAIQSNDSRQIATNWQSFLRIAGYSEKKNKGFAMMETAEDPARKKLYDAARLIREQKYPLAQLALEEARQLAGQLPIGVEAQQSLDCMKLIQKAVNISLTAASSKQKLQIAGYYQQILSKYPENPLATVAYQRLLTMR